MARALHPNTGRIPAFLGVKPTLVGLYGQDKIDPAFEEFTENCHLVSLREFGRHARFRVFEREGFAQRLEVRRQFYLEDFVASFPGGKMARAFRRRGYPRARVLVAGHPTSTIS